MKRFSSLSIAAPIALLLLAAAPSVFSDEHDQKTDVTITEAIQVPGAVLQPGTYMFILLNSTTDRHMVEVKSPDGKHLYSMSFATAARRVFPTDNVAMTFYEMPQGAPPALRQWFWPGEREGQELLYPHGQAADIQAGSHQTVAELTDQEAATVAAQSPAASDAGSATASVAQSSKQSGESVQAADQQIADQPVQPAPPAGSKQSIESRVDQDQVVAQVQAAPPADNSVVDNSVNAAPAQSSVTVAQNDAPIVQNYAQNNTPAPAPQSTNTDNSDNSSLPKTASNLPLIGLAGLVSLASAVTLRLARRRA